MDKPVPGKGQLLIEVRAASMNALDYANFAEMHGRGKLSFMAWSIDHFMMPKIGRVAGTEVAGVVVEVGEGASGYHPGDAVMGVTSGFCGGWGELALVDGKAAMRKPECVSFECAATVAMPTTAAYGAVSKAGIRAGQEVLVYGVSGGMDSTRFCSPRCRVRM